MYPYISLLRINVCLLSVLALLISSILAHAFVFELFYAFVAVFLICGAGNVINDYFDIYIDKINKPHRPIASGNVSKKNALNYFIFLCISGLIFAYLVSPDLFILALINVIILFFYSWKFKSIALLGNIIVSYLASSSFLAGGLILGTFYSINHIILILFTVSFFGTLSREVLKDIEDEKGDKKLKLKTLPILIGSKKSKLFAYTILLFACILLLLPVFVLSILYLIGMLPGIGICLYAIYSHKNVTKSQKLIKLAMFIIILGFLLGTI